MEETNIIILQISIPNNKIIPNIISTFTPEENYAMIEIGSNAIIEARKSVISFTNEKIASEYKFKIDELKNEINVEKQLAMRLNERMVTIYEEKLNKLNERMQYLSHELLEKSKNNEEIMSYEIEKIKNKYEMMLEENQKQLENKYNIDLEQIKIKTDAIIEAKENQVSLIVNTFDKTIGKIIATNSNKSAHIGIRGETVTFYDLANTFKDFNGYSIQDKRHETNAGDFHLHFENMDILVDAKNYDSAVGKNQKDKIRKDLIKNQHMNIAWLVSLNTKITSHDRFPIMYEFINTNQCVVYINNLMGDGNPDKLLRIAWLVSSMLNDKIKLLNVEDSDELSNLKNKYYTSLDKVKHMRSTISELNSCVKKIKTQIDTLDTEVIHILQMEMNELMETHYPKMDEWWDANVEYTEDDSQLLSTNVWHLFKQHNKSWLVNNKIDADDFKKYIMTKLSSDYYTKKGKSGAIIINHYKLKINVVSESNEESNDEPTNTPLKKPVLNSELKIKVTKTPKSKTYYINEEVDNKIILDYENKMNDINQIAIDNNIEVYKVVSILMKHKIISSRSDARGHEIYSQSEEYKNKIKFEKI